MKCYSS